MIKARWYNLDNNWGDKINPILINKISGNKVVYTKKMGSKKFIVVGSIMHYADDNSIVWGAGFISNKHKTRGKPKICAVRGPLTRKILLNDNISCPEIYGDPVLLYKNYYNPKIEIKHEIGIIPHYVDKNVPWVQKIIEEKSNDIKIIDIQGEVNQFIKDIKSCKTILSSSLHGIIAPDAYGIKSYWIKLSDKVVGGNFKFNDYKWSVNRKLDPILINKNDKLQDILKNVDEYELNFDENKLYEACPFKP